MKFIASIVLVAAIQVISSKWIRRSRGDIQNNLAVIDQTACANADSFALNVGIGNANANSVAVADNNNNINQRNGDTVRGRRVWPLCC